jgi:alpha-glucosidase
MRSPNCVRTSAFLAVLVPFAAFAQDERRVLSPDRQLDFRLFLAPQEDRAITRIAYQVFYRGQPLVRASFLGLDIWSQEPLLGEATGLITSHAESHANYNALTANYMQNGSLGRLLNIEVRVYNEGIAFRYVIPGSTPLRELLIADEATEFVLPLPIDPPPTLPLILQQTVPAWIEISEIPTPNFPAMHLIRSEGNTLLSRLSRQASNPAVVFEGTTPLTCPWRVIVTGSARESLSHSTLFEELSRSDAWEKGDRAEWGAQPR